MANLTILEALSKSLAATKKYIDDNKVTDTSKTYTLNLTSSIASYNGNVFICYYNGSKSYISCSSNYIGSYQSSAEQFTAELSFPANAKYIKLRFFTDRGASNVDKSVITLTVNATEQGEVTDGLILFDNGLKGNYTISNGSNYTVDNVITLSPSPNTYFGFDQSVTFNAGDSINFVINSCSSDASTYITRVCYFDDLYRLQTYNTVVTDNIVKANLPYTFTHTFNQDTTCRPALLKYFGEITISKVYVTRANSK